MRQERMRTASIDDKLQDLISKSDVIVRLLQGQLDMLNVQKVTVEANLTGTLTDREDDRGRAGGGARRDWRDGPQASSSWKTRSRSNRTPPRGPSWKPIWPR